MSLKDVRANLDEGGGHLQSAATGLNSLLGNNVPTDTASIAESQGASETIRTLDYFKAFRKYRICEQGLLNHRLTWNLALQGFLFATYGLSLQKLAELQAKENGADITLKQARYTVEQLRILLQTTPWIGLLLSICVLLAVCGSWFSLRNLKREWDTKVPHNENSPYIPNPSGGGSNVAFYLGFVPPAFIPMIFAVAWLYILLRR